MPPKKSIEFNIKISPKDHAMLSELATAKNKSRSEILRATITTAFRMQFAGDAYCVSGQACFCPTMHRIDSAVQLTDDDLLQKVIDENERDKKAA